MRLHGDRQPTTRLQKKDGSSALFTGSDNEVWSFGDANYPILVDYMDFRELMRPYTRQLMREASEKGSPVIRSLFYEFPQDENAWQIQDEYLYGPDILVAPITELGALSREVYLPAGSTWTNLHTGDVHQGGTLVRADAPLDVIPLFLRDGTHPEWVGTI
jgi:alpha-D-xyloside xylohydrolase